MHTDILIKIQYLLLSIMIMLFAAAPVYTQWVNDPSINTKLVSGTNDPVNINVLDDNKGGMFVIWQDSKIPTVTDVLFIHTNGSGEVSFRADGKSVSANGRSKEQPRAIVDNDGNLVIVWKELDPDSTNIIYIQKLASNGSRLWSEQGIRIVENELEIIDFAIDFNKDNVICISYLMREPGFTGDYMIEYRFINSDGRLAEDISAGSSLFRSHNRKSKSSVVSDYEGGAFFFWLENLSGKSILRASYINKNFNPGWESTVLNLSDTTKSVLSYTADRYGNSVYLTFQYHGKHKVIHHQLVTRSGKFPWGNECKPVTSLAGSQFNQQTAVIDSVIYLSFTSEFGNDKDVYLQKFDKNGAALWNAEGLPVIKTHGDQFGQKITNDKKGNIIIAWIDRRIDSVYGNIFAQKINSNGMFLWDSLSLDLGSFYNSHKSYLNLIADGAGGAVAVFKEKREGSNEIFAQKIFSSGTYASQLLAFSASVEGDKIKLSWFAANESPDIVYQVERTTQADLSVSDWAIVGSVPNETNQSLNYYEFFDVPDTNGTLYYRLIQKNKDDSETGYELLKINYLETASSIAITQNTPNPFKDSTTIVFFLPQEEKVSIEFFNSKLELIKEYPAANYPAGKHEIVFKESNLSPGIYFYRVKTGKHIEVKKMVVSSQ